MMDIQITWIVTQEIKLSGLQDKKDKQNINSADIEIFSKTLEIFSENLFRFISTSPIKL